MFTVVIDGNIVYDPDLISIGNVIFSPRLTVGLNKSGEFSFVVPCTNPFYDQIGQISSEVFVLNNGSYEDVLFIGRVLNVSIDFNKMKTVNCEGALSYLVDSVLRPYTFEGSPNELFEYYVGHHNAIVDPDTTLGKRLSIGTVDVDAGTQIIEYSTSYVSTIEEIKNKLLNQYGGYIVTRWDNRNNRIVLDYINNVGRNNPQLIQYSRNLLDLIEEQPAENIYTVAIPLGAQLVDERTGKTLERVSLRDYPNEGDPDYVEAPQEFLDRFGRIERAFIFDSVETQAELQEIGQNLVSVSALIPSKISIKAIDLNLVDSTFKQIKVGDLMSVVSPPHNVDRQMLCTGIDYDLFNPENTVYDFEIETTYSPGNTLTQMQSDTGQQINNYYTQSLGDLQNAMDIAQQHLSDAMAEASSEIANALGGYVYKTYSDLFIMNTDDINTATSVWRWNLGGLGYWSGEAGHALDSSAQYTIAITASGTINAEVLRGELMETIEFNAVLGRIGEWQLSPVGIYKVVADRSEPNKAYRVSLYPPSSINPGTAKVLSFDVSSDYAATFNPSFYIRGDGSFFIASPNKKGVERIKIYDQSDPNNSYTVLNSNGVHVSRPREGFSALVSHLWSSSLEFRNANGELTASYDGEGWYEATVRDPDVIGEETTWRVLRNGYFMTMVCRRQFSNVVVDHPWGNIYCGPNDSIFGSGCNFKAAMFPYTFDFDPIVIAQLDAPNGMEDGWLVTNGMWTQSRNKTYLPAYNLARGTSGTVQNIAVNYFVFGYCAPKYYITNNLTNVSNDNSATFVTDAGSYYATLTATEGQIVSVSVLMDGEDITDQVYFPDLPRTGAYNIEAVVNGNSQNLVITDANGDGDYDIASESSNGEQTLTIVDAPTVT